MEKSSFKAHFQDLWIVLHRPMLKSFVHKLVAANYQLTWRQNEQGIDLEIHSIRDKLLLPMKLENDRKTIINMKELEIITEELAFCLEELIAESKGSAIVRTTSDGANYVSFFDQGKVVSVLKTGGGESKDMDPYHKVRRKTHQLETVPKSVNLYVVTAEIDYFLIELKDAIDSEDYNESEKIKQKLSKLAKEKAELTVELNN